MNFFTDTLPTFLNKTGEWIDGVFNTPVKTATTPTSGSTPQFAQGKDIIGSTLEKGLNLIKTQFQRSSEAQNKLAQSERNLTARAFGITDPEKIAKIPTVDPFAMLGMEKKVTGEVIKKAPQTIKAFAEEGLQQGKGVVESIKNIFKKPVTPQISPKIAPELVPETKLPSPTTISPKSPVLTEKVGGGVNGGVGKVERGFVTSVKQAYPEMKVAGQYIPRETDTLAIKAKNLIKDDIMSAEAQARTGTDDNAVAIASELIKHYGDEAAKATNTATRVALNDRAAEIANDIAHKLTESGRSVQAASILGRLTPEGQVRFAAREIQKYNEMIDSAKGGMFGLKKKIPELTGKQADEIITEMKAINSMATGEEKAIRFQALQDRITKLIPSSLYQKVVAVWKAGLLTGLKTTGVNLFSNASHFGSEVIKDIPATAVDKVASLFTGERTLALSMKSKEGIKEGFNKGLRYLRTGYDERNIATKLDYHKVNFGNSAIGKGLQKYEETVFGLLGAEDQPFYYGAKARSLYNQAKAQAINKGLKGTEAQKFIDNLVSNPTDKMLTYAVGDAETAVFQNQTVLGNIAKAIQRAPGGEIVLPFGRTPAAVATQIINYSPVGIATTIFKNLGKGRFDQRLFSQGIGRGLTGTAVMAIGATAFAKGLVALDRPTSEKEQKLWELEGRKANTFYDPISKKWRSIQVLGPAGNVLLIGAHFQDALQNSGSPTEAMSTMAFGSLKSFSEQTFLTGINQVTSALSDPQRSAPAYAGSILSSTIPTLISDIARATDTKERRPESILQKFEARVPGLREMLEPQVNVLGQEIDTVGNPIEIMADPTRPSPSSDSPIVAEFRRLWNNGFKISPTLLGDKTGFQGLTPEQNTELWKRAGEITQSKITSLLSKNEYWNLNDEQKSNIISDITDKSKLMARVEMVLQLTDGLSGQELIAKLSELKKGGLMTQAVYNEFQRLR